MNLLPALGPMGPSTVALLFVAALLGGALNSVAGGGSFLSFPSLIFAGVPPINANATSTVALWPGSVASVFAYREELGRHDRRFVVSLSLISLVGGVLGSVLLLRTSQATFARLLPWLLLVATLLFALGSRITAQLRRRFSLGSGQSREATLAVALFQLVIALYGGYFGGGIGILMLAALGLLGLRNIHEMNALKTLLAGAINGIAVLIFVVAGVVAWPQALLMLVGATIGGYGCASYARRLNPKYVRVFVILVGVSMTAYFFLRG
ncbi:MAG: sulfite exporter TauE/SafE family protein [Chloroflexi bacterium]|nr:sulfite exporter TauE/SafE family protein [Chloroflexota bacterium]